MSKKELDEKFCCLGAILTQTMEYLEKRRKKLSLKRRIQNKIWSIHYNLWHWYGRLNEFTSEEE